MSFFPPILTPIAQGISNGTLMLGLTMGAEAAQNCRITSKAQTALEPFAQTLEQTASTRAVTQALQAAGHQPISSSLGWVLFLTPTVTYLGISLLSKGTIRSSLERFQPQISTLFFIAFLVSQVALVYLTPGPQALSCLIFIAASKLYQSDWLHTKISGVYQNILYSLVIGSQIVLTQPGLVAYLMFGASLGAHYLFFRWLKALPPEAPNIPGRLSQEQLTQFRTDAPLPNNFKIHRDHIHWAALPHAPELTLESLMDQWNLIPWSKYQASSIEETKNKLQKKITQTKEIQSHLFPHMDLLLIAERLFEQEEAVRADLLWKLASNFEDNYSFVFARLIEKLDTTPFRKKVLQVLQILRTDLTQKESAKRMKEMLGDAGAQMPNVMIGPVRAQPSVGFINLMLNRGVQQLIPNYTVDDLLSEMGYHPQAMVKAIQERISKDPSFKKEAEQWLKERFPEPIINQNNLMITDKIILAMLYDFGIIQGDLVKKIESRPATHASLTWGELSRKLVQP
ncbi:MAG TPA: hypothetical protein VGM34_02190 [Chlamydiales bacterium]|jgi:hypothetical protein